MPIVNGTTYHKDTPEAVIRVLENARQTGTRLRIWYGDRETGRDWLEEWDVIGYIRRSMGPVCIPILIYNTRSYGGSGLLEHCILKIAETKSKRVLYQAPNYQPPSLTTYTPPKSMLDEGYTTAVYRDNVNVANFKTQRKAENYVAFMLGKRMRH